MTKPNDSASPIKGQCSEDPIRGIRIDAQPGLTKRELFAAMAMQGILADQLVKYADIAINKEANMGQLISEDAVGFADALIEALSK